MKDIQLILASNYPTTQERIEGKLVYLDNYEITNLYFPSLTRVMNLDFFKAKFFTGYRKFTRIDVVVGLSGNQTYLLLNPLFSDDYSNLIDRLELINSSQIDANLLDEIVTMYKETGANITPIGRSSNVYQIWFGETKWRILKLKAYKTLKVKTIPNYGWGMTRPTWMMKFIARFSK